MSAPETIPCVRRFSSSSVAASSSAKPFLTVTPESRTESFSAPGGVIRSGDDNVVTPGRFLNSGLKLGGVICEAV